MASQNIADWNITLDQLVDQIREEVCGAVDKHFDFFQKTISSYPLGDTELYQVSLIKTRGPTGAIRWT